MGYVRTAGMSTAARRRRRRTALVLSALLLLLLLVFGYAVAYFEGWLPDEGSGDAAQVTATATPTDEALAPADVTVNVYNATGRPGLAGRTAEQLTSRGFVVDSVDNDPERATIEHEADIRHGAEGEEAAELLASHFTDARLVPDERQGEEVDLVLGNAFEETLVDTATSTG